MPHNRNNSNGNFIQRTSSRVSNFIDNQFYKFGFLVASHPWNTIITILLVVLMCGVGFIRFHDEKNALELWVPKDSRFYANTEWLIENLQLGYRVQSVLITAPNVLEPEFLRKALKIHQEIIQVKGTFTNNTIITWPDTCLKVPFIGDTGGLNVTTIDHHRRRRRQNEKNIDFNGNNNNNNNSAIDILFNPSVYLDSKTYCKIISKIPFGCYERNLLEIWKYNDDLIRNSTINDILMKLKETTHGPITGHETNFTEFLSGIERDSNNNIISAKAILFEWFNKINFTNVDSDKTGNIAGTQDWVTEDVAFWESEFLEKITELKNKYENDDIKIYYSSGRSFGDLSSQALFEDIGYLVGAVVLMSVYVLIIVSKFSWTEIRFLLSGMGLFSIGAAFISGCGICSALGISYGPVHTSLPFLLLGLGVDDMFVIVACWRNIKKKTDSIEERIALTLKDAGASITITSVTDIVAFLVGSITVIPSLKSFCFYAAIGISLTYLYVVTFFIAIFTLDERRIRSNRNAFIPCIAHKENTRKLWCEPNILQNAFSWIYSKFILTKPGKIIVIMTVIGLTSFSGESITRLKQQFDQNWFIPESTYLHKYIEKMKFYFPDSGYEGQLFTGKMNYTENLVKLVELSNEIEARDDIFYKVESWTKPFFQFVKLNYNKDLNKEIISDYHWRFYLSKFLYSPDGGKYQAFFRFDKVLKCGEPTPNVTVSIMQFRFKRFVHRSEYVPSMYLIQNLVDMKNFTKNNEGYAGVWAKTFPNWMIDEIIDVELLRNIGLVTVCVMVVTILLIADIQVCFWIFICVLLTLINVCGFMYQWGLTIDITTSIGLQLAVGLCVDYAAHIGHSYIVQSDDDRNSRAMNSILHIGSAVFNGGFSTFLAIIMLKFSEAYTFQAFFKIFTLVIIFGLFHGMVFLPVILSLIGPISYKSEKNNVALNGNIGDGEELQPITKNGNVENHAQ